MPLTIHLCKEASLPFHKTSSCSDPHCLSKWMFFSWNSIITAPGSPHFLWHKPFLSFLTVACFRVMRSGFFFCVGEGDKCELTREREKRTFLGLESACALGLSWERTEGKKTLFVSALSLSLSLSLFHLSLFSFSISFRVSALALFFTSFLLLIYYTYFRIISITNFSLFLYFSYGTVLDVMNPTTISKTEM